MTDNTNDRITEEWLSTLVDWTSFTRYQNDGVTSTYYEVGLHENSDTIIQVCNGSVWAKDGEYENEVSIAHCDNRGELVDLLKALKIRINLAAESNVDDVVCSDPEGAKVPLALDVSLEKPRALHRVWRALNDGDCPKCHKYHPATNMVRRRALQRPPRNFFDTYESVIQCPSCGFAVTKAEIEAIEKMFAPAMDAAVKIFEEWRASQKTDLE